MVRQPCWWASQEGHREVVELLLAHGADVHAKTNNGVTAMRIAFNRNETEIVQLLKNAGAKE